VQRSATREPYRSVLPCLVRSWHLAVARWQVISPNTVTLGNKLARGWQQLFHIPVHAVDKVTCRSHFTQLPKTNRCFATNASTRHVQILGLPARSRCCSAAEGEYGFNTGRYCSNPTVALPCSNTTCAKLMDRPPQIRHTSTRNWSHSMLVSRVNSRASQQAWECFSKGA